MDWKPRETLFSFEKWETVDVCNGGLIVSGDVLFDTWVWIAAVGVAKQGAEVDDRMKSAGYIARFSSKEEAKAWVEERILDQCDPQRPGRPITEGMGLQMWDGGE